MNHIYIYICQDFPQVIEEIEAKLDRPTLIIKVRIEITKKRKMK